jgi:tetratricopeptide (TPR) repeat protein
MTLSHRVHTRLAALPAIALFAFASFFVIREGLAELLAIQANQLLAQWEAGRPPTRLEFESAERSISGAISLSPSNGDHWESLGSAWFARASSPGRTIEGRIADYDRAVEAYREATRRTTVSGYAWANLLVAKHYAGQIDPEFSTALRNAARFGPHEAAVQGMIVATVLPRWIELDSEARKLAAETVVRGWPVHRDALLAEASGASRRELWCDAALWPPEETLAAAMRRLCAATARPRQTRPDGASPRAP